MTTGGSVKNSYPYSAWQKNALNLYPWAHRLRVLNFIVTMAWPHLFPHSPHRKSSRARWHESSPKRAFGSILLPKLQILLLTCHIRSLKARAWPIAQTWIHLLRRLLRRRISQLL